MPSCLMQHRSSGVARSARCLLLVFIAQLAAAWPVTVHATSSWSPTLLVNTEAFQVIDDTNTSSNVSIKFGNSLNKSLIYDRTNSRFKFDAPLYVQGNLGVTGAMSGNSLYINTTIAGGGLTSCSNSTTSKLLWNSATQQFECGTDQGGAGGGLTQAQIDGLFVNQSGDTMTGGLLIQNGNPAGTIESGLLLEVRGTASGDVVHAQSQLRSSGALVVEGASSFEGALTFGDAIGDAITVNAATWTFANDTNFALSGGVNGLSFDTSTLSIDAQNDRVGIGTTTPEVALETVGTMSGVSLTVSSLRNCDTIDTNANGVLSCGTDATGSGGLDETAANSLYLKKSGGTMTGALTIDVANTSNGTALTVAEQAQFNSGATLSGVLAMNATSNPSTPGTDTLKVYARNVSGRMLLKGIGPSGVDYPYQPSFFQNMITMINTNTTTSVGAIGNTVTSAGTLSHPTATEAYGWMTNFATAATANSTAGTGNNGTLWFRGSTAGANGFFFNARLAYPDSSYGAGSTGARTFIGMTNQTMATMVGADNPAGHYAGFQFSTNRGDTNWQFTTKDNTTQNVVNTGLAFSAQKVYDAFIYCTPQCASISWRIDNVTDGTTAEGSTSTNLPGGSTALRGGFQLATLTTTARNIRMQRVYIESDR